MNNCELYSILILDDDVQLGELLKIYLEASGPFQVEQIVMGSDLPARLAAKKYHLLLLDYHLPDTTGLDVLNELAADENHLPVIMMTGKGDQRIAAQTIQRGADDYLLKGSDFLPGLPALIQKTVRMHELQEAARESMEQVRYQALLLDNMRDAVVVWNMDGIITFWNPAAFLLFGRKPKDMVGQPVETAYLNLFTPPVNLPCSGDTATSETEREFQSPDGHSFWISARLMPLRSPEKGHAQVGFMDVSRNITARKQKDARIQQANAQLLQAARLSAVGQLATGVAHQISNPLTAILGEAQLLLQSLPQGDPLRESVELIEAAGWRAQWVVQVLNTFAEPDSSTISSVDLGEAIRLAVSLIGINLQSDGVTLSLELPGEPLFVRANPRQIEALWVNLLLFIRSIINKQPCQLMIQAVPLGDETIAIETVLNGVIVTGDQLDTVFDPELAFSSGDTISGMEFSICQEIARQNQGTIEVTNHDHRSTFSVILPKEN